MSTDNPFASPAGGHEPQYHGSGNVQPRSSVDYLEIFSKVFEHPNWFVNILLTGLVTCIPIIGAMVVNGFGLVLVDERSTGRTNSYPDFDFNRFADYLIRGVWVFLVGLIVAVCMFPISFVEGIVFAVAQSSGNDVVALVATLLHFAFAIGLNVLMMLIVMPMGLRAGMTNSFGEAFNFAFIKDFLGKMWMEQIAGLLIWSILSWFIVVIGMLLFCIGIIPAFGIVMIAYWNLATQLYQVYVGRGGQEIPFQNTN